ncbi:MAG: competence/damage-inducible protein A [Halobacteriales archaeon]
MQVAVITVGDELLAGETENANATWLAGELTERGATVARSLTVPDERETIARYVREWSDAFDAVLVTGGLGGTPDDVTMEAVADAFDREMVVQADVRETVVEKGRRFREENPDLAEEYDFDPDYDATASLPDGARPLVTAESFAPGAVVENVYVFPGFPEELRVMFGAVADEFGGETVSETLYTPSPEGALTGTLAEAEERFDPAIASYPTKGDSPARVKVTGEDAAAVEEAVAWLREHIEVTDATDGPDPGDPSSRTG